MTQERLMRASAFTCEQEPCLEEERWVTGVGGPSHALEAMNTWTI